jgi:hypothetical protein
VPELLDDMLARWAVDLVDDHDAFRSHQHPARVTKAFV